MKPSYFPSRAAMCRAIAVSLTLSAASTGNAAIVLSGNFNTGTPTPTLTITEDIVFNITTGGSTYYLVFDEWTVFDGSDVGVNDLPAQSFSFALNDSAGTTELYALTDSFPGSFGSVTANDGSLLFNQINVIAGDILTVKAGSYTFGNHTSFNLALAGISFTGDTFLADGGFNRLSNIVTVPEPSAALLGAMGGLFLLRRKR